MTYHGIRHERTGLSYRDLHHQQRAERGLAVTLEPHPLSALRGIWLPQARHLDLSGRRGNGPFSGTPGAVLHVNASGTKGSGTSPDWYKNGGGPDEVCPNFQIMRDGTIWQLLPLNWQPWTQADGNSWGIGIETAGDPSEQLNPKMFASVKIVWDAMVKHMGTPNVVTNHTGTKGFGTHAMGGAAWGGHTSCPGARASQRAAMVAGAAGKDWFDMATEAQLAAAVKAGNAPLVSAINSAVKAVNAHTDAVTKAIEGHTTAIGTRVRVMENAMTTILLHGDKDHPNSLDSLADTLAKILEKQS
jgi:hypothetical protein